MRHITWQQTEHDEWDVMLDYYGSPASKQEQAAAYHAIVSYVPIVDDERLDLDGDVDAGEPYVALECLFACIPDNHHIPPQLLKQGYDCLNEEAQDEFRHVLHTDNKPSAS